MTGPDSTQPPLEVQLSTLCWVAAVAAGGVESILGAVEAGFSLTAAVVLVLRAVVYTAVLWVASHLWLGRNSARWTLAIGSLIGTPALLAGPLDWLANPNELTIDATLVSLASVRALHIAAILTAITLMFRPAVAGYFRHGTVTTAARRRTCLKTY